MYDKVLMRIFVIWANQAFKIRSHLVRKENERRRRNERVVMPTKAAMGRALELEMNALEISIRDVRQYVA